MSQQGSIQCNYTLVLAITINSPFQLERTDRAQVTVQHNVLAINPCCMPLVAIPLVPKVSCENTEREKQVMIQHNAK